MTDTVVLYINGKRHEIAGESVFAPLTDYLRYTACKTGTKVVCAEGDCGACSVLVGKLDKTESKEGIQYQAVNGCIQYIYQLHGTHIVTVEGVCEPEKMNPVQLNPVQESMMVCHGAQCGYCTPGFIVTMSNLFFNQQAKGEVTPANNKIDAQEIKNTLTGNLCRCTGYESILNAGVSTDVTEMPVMSSLYNEPEIENNLKQLSQQTVTVETDEQTVYIPTTLKEALNLLSANPDARLVTGGTDLHVICNKRYLAPPVIVSLSQLEELNTIAVNQNSLSIGANCTLGKLEAYLRKKQLLPEVTDMLHIFGSPQIKHAGTLAGNVANGSPIADTLPFLFVLNAELELSNTAGSRRVNINDFYTGYKTTVMKPGEMITGVHLPLPKPGENLKLYKVSRREHLDISAFTAGFLITLNNNVIDTIKIAYGGVGPTVIQMKNLETFLTGKPFELETFEEAGKIAVEEITPIDDVRGSKEYRLQLAQNILLKLFYECAEDHAKITCEVVA